jgi:hypothetical protein
MACLIAHYCNATDITRLSAKLGDPAVVADVPMPVLLRAAAMLGPDQIPAAAQRQIVASLCGQLQAQFSREQVVIFAKPCWQTETAAMTLSCEGLQFPGGKTTHYAANSQHYFAGTGDGGMALLAADRGMPLQLELKYPDAPVIRLHMHWVVWDGGLPVPPEHHVQKHDSHGLKLFVSSSQRRHTTLVQPDKYSFRITEFEYGEDRVPIHKGKGEHALPPIAVPAAPASPSAPPMPPAITAPVVTVPPESIPMSPPPPATPTAPAEPKVEAPAASAGEPSENEAPVPSTPEPDTCGR